MNVEYVLRGSVGVDWEKEVIGRGKEKGRAFTLLVCNGAVILDQLVHRGHE